jgi:hypothetical protein
MSDATTNLQLPLLAPACAQKHVTVNEALLRLDAPALMTIQSRIVSAQPSAPADGALFILPPGKTGADWGGMADRSIAYYRDGAWVQLTPNPGWGAFVLDEGTRLTFRNGAWRRDVAVAPAGLVMLCANAAAPAGWLTCAGQLVSRTAYPLLFAAIGQTYGAGDGATTFGIPDLRPRNVGLPTGMTHAISTGE